MEIITAISYCNLSRNIPIVQRKFFLSVREMLSIYSQISYGPLKGRILGQTREILDFGAIATVLTVA